MKTWNLLLMSVCLTSCISASAEKYQTVMDSATADKVNNIILTRVIPAVGKSHGELIDDVSSAFLGTPYKDGTLIGSLDTPEELVVNFNEVDCYTLIDYVEALTRSHDQKTFLQNLVRIRYIHSKVDYLSRRHFFTDWFANAPRDARDVTPEISPDYVTVEKQLNRKADGSKYIPGLETIPRKINYIPGSAINENVLNNLKTGDYIGVYSLHEGLDVSHTGMVVRHDGKVWFRHASSLAVYMKVVDVPFIEYMSSKPGIVVLRAD
ncbi:DUF1460 domain-containing protein [Pectobacterium versatile]|uniref:DUF1460 domain-containing protein n=1 Tax=Pectobacterium versatile TaxID=2488639 RepID=UPI001F1BE102|nr:DUF1460 domain-containing protein [Pectobacterium versatile]